MSTWQQFTDEAPELAAAVAARFTATKHHVLASLRADGAPRVSGTEVDFRGGELTLGSMWQARKAHDLQRDPRCAIHANPGDGSMAGGDAKVSGLAVEIVDEAELRRYIDEEKPPEPFHLFRLDLREAVLTAVSDDQKYLTIKLWRPAQGVRELRAD